MARKRRQRVTVTVDGMMEDPATVWAMCVKAMRDRGLTNAQWNVYPEETRMAWARQAAEDVFRQLQANIAARA